MLIKDVIKAVTLKQAGAIAQKPEAPENTSIVPVNVHLSCGVLSMRILGQNSKFNLISLTILVWIYYVSNLESEMPRLLYACAKFPLNTY